MDVPILLVAYFQTKEFIKNIFNSYIKVYSWIFQIISFSSSLSGPASIDRNYKFSITTKGW